MSAAKARQPLRFFRHAPRAIALFLIASIFMCSCAPAHADRTSVTILDQQDRAIECKKSDVKPTRGVSILTGKKSNAAYQPVLIEYNNENGGINSSIPYGISAASIVYEYQTNTNGTMGISALFQDTLPSKVGPIGDASVGGAMVQNDWKCGYVYQDMPKDNEGNLTELGYSIQMWFASQNALTSHVLYPANVGRFKAWKKYFKEDLSIFTAYRNFVDISGIQSLLTESGVSPTSVPFHFIGKKDKPQGDVTIQEIDISGPSRTYYSGFVFNTSDKLYYRWVGKSQYLDGETGKQLAFSNVIIQRVDYITSNGLMAPNTIGKGNAEIFINGLYIEGYWVRESTDDHTRFYDSEGNPLRLAPGKTFISFQTMQTPIILIDW